MANWWDNDPVASPAQIAQAQGQGAPPAITGTDFSTAPMPAPPVAQMPQPAPQAPQAAPQMPPAGMAPGSAGAQIYAPRPPQSAFAGLPPEILMLSGMAGPQQGMQFLSPFLSAPPVEVMGPNGPMFVQRHQAFGMPSPGTVLGFRKEDRENFNSPIMRNPDGTPSINWLLGQTPEFLLKAATAGSQIRNTQSEIANRPIQPGGPNGAPGTVNPAWAAMESLKLGQGNTEKAYEAIIGAGKDARSALGTVNQLNALLDQINTGRLTTTTTNIKALAKGLGINLEAMGVRDDVGPAQAAMALSNQLALTLRNPSTGAGMPGALSDGDRQFLASMVPSIEGTPEGRVLMVDWAKRLYQHQIELTRVANAFMQSPEAATNPRGLQIVLQRYSDANPIFSEADAARIKELSSRPPAPPTMPPSAAPQAPGQPGLPPPPPGFRPLR